MQRTAVLSGITGQDSSYLAELLLEKGYQVVGLMRRSSTATTERIDHLRSHPDFHLVEGDITDAANMYRLVSQWKPDEFYNLAAMSHVGTSFEQPLATFQIDALGVLNILEAIRQTSPRTRFYQASTSELFGDTTEAPQNEQTRFNPCSPYAVSKLAAHHLVELYRKAYGLYACAGILFNHESSRRSEQFVTRKITRYVGRLVRAIVTGESHPGKLRLGNLDARRDWAHAADSVRAMHLMLQQDIPDDYVIATGETRTIREFLDAAFGVIGVDWSDYVVVDPEFLRPADVNLLCGDASKARRVLGWSPVYSFSDLVNEMVATDLALHGLTLDRARQIVTAARGDTCPVS